MKKPPMGVEQRRERGEAGRSQVRRAVWAVLKIQGEQKVMAGSVFYHLQYLVNSLKHRVYIQLTQNSLTTRKFHLQIIIITLCSGSSRIFNWS